MIPKRCQHFLSIACAKFIPSHVKVPVGLSDVCMFKCSLCLIVTKENCHMSEREEHDQGETHELRKRHRTKTPQAEHNRGQKQQRTRATLPRRSKRQHYPPQSMRLEDLRRCSWTCENAGKMRVPTPNASQRKQIARKEDSFRHLTGKKSLHARKAQPRLK